MQLEQHSKHFPDSFFRGSIRGLCVQDGKVLLMKEPAELSGQWELPGGGLDFGEKPHEALKREALEEMGLEATSVSKRPLYVWTSKFINRRDMDWFYALVLVYQMELRSFDFTPTPECEEIGFFSRDELQTLDLFHQAANLREVFNPEDFVKSDN